MEVGGDQGGERTRGVPVARANDFDLLEGKLQPPQIQGVEALAVGADVDEQVLVDAVPVEPQHLQIWAVKGNGGQKCRVEVVRALYTRQSRSG